MEIIKQEHHTSSDEVETYQHPTYKGISGRIVGRVGDCIELDMTATQGLIAEPKVFVNLATGRFYRPHWSIAEEIILAAWAAGQTEPYTYDIYFDSKRRWPRSSAYDAEHQRLNDEEGKESLSLADCRKALAAIKAKHLDWLKDLKVVRSDGRIWGFSHYSTIDPGKVC